MKPNNPVPRLFQWVLISLCAWASGSSLGWAATTNVNVGDNFFSPANVTINVNDRVKWTWIGFGSHSSTANSSLWDSGIRGNGSMFTNTFASAGSFPYFCRVHPFQTGGVTVQSGNSPPTVTITNPPTGTVFNAPASFTLAASASDAGGSVSQVEFFRGTTSVGVDSTSPYTAMVNSLIAGNYTFSAVATDNAGAKATNAITVTVNALPTVAILAPTNGATFGEPLTTQLQATAADGDGSVRGVNFLSGTSVLGTVTNAPYQLTVSNVLAGTYTLTAEATDDRGGKTTSAAVTIVVVSPVPIRLSSVQRPSATNFQFRYTANNGLSYVVERAASLPNFTPINTNTATSNSVSFQDRGASAGRNFYRVRRVPNP